MTLQVEAYDRFVNTCVKKSLALVPQLQKSLKMLGLHGQSQTGALFNVILLGHSNTYYYVTTSPILFVQAFMMATKSACIKVLSLALESRLHYTFHKISSLTKTQVIHHAGSLIDRAFLFICD